MKRALILKQFWCDFNVACCELSLILMACIYAKKRMIQTTLGLVTRHERGHSQICFEKLGRADRLTRKLGLEEQNKNLRGQKRDQ